MMNACMSVGVGGVGTHPSCKLLFLGQVHYPDPHLVYNMQRTS